MQFSKLCEYFEKLEQTSSRLSLIDILSDLFKKSSKDEIEKIVYLTQGRIAPFFEPIEIGMAEKNVAQAIAMSCGFTKEEVLKLYGKLGDMGKVAEQLSTEINDSNGRLSHVANDAQRALDEKSNLSSSSLSEHRSPKSNKKLDVKTGSTFSSFASKKSSIASHNRSLSVSDVFEILATIAKTGGAGSVEKKQNFLTDLLGRVGSNCAKYLVRIPLGNLRLGIGDPTILDALATAKLGDKTNRKLLEGAYNRTSDLGLIAKTLWTHGLPAVEKLKVIVGKPIRSELCERLPTPEKAIEKMGVVDVQYKYDGFRVEIHKDGDKVSMFSRNLENMTHMFPELIKGTLKQVKAKTAILDTEALAYNPDSEEFLPFQETTKRRRKHNISDMAKKLPLKAFVFDILYKDGESLIDKPLKERMKILKETIKTDDILIPSETRTIDNPKELGLMLDDAISRGLEGVVIKKIDSKYEAGGRNFNWVKLKRHSAGELHDTIDTVILGYIFGRGKRAEFGAGALLVGVYDEKRDMFVTVSRIGTGLSDEEWREIHKRADKIKVDHKPARVESVITPSVWIKPEIVIEVLADEITRSPIHTAGASISKTGEKEPGYALRFPRLVNFRGSDKRAEDATTVKELIEMYEQSRGAGSSFARQGKK